MFTISYTKLVTYSDLDVIDCELLLKMLTVSQVPYLDWYVCNVLAKKMHWKVFMFTNDYYEAFELLKKIIKIMLSYACMLVT